MVGDMISLDNLPGVAQVAIQGAKYAAKEIDGRLKGKPPQEPFKYFDKGSMAIISRFRAVAMVGKLRLTGVIAWLMWLAVHLVYITGFKNRVTAVLHWAVSFLGRGRSERTTTEQQIFARSRAGAAQARRRRPGLRPGGVRRRAASCWRRPGAPSSRPRRAEEARLTDAGRARRARGRARAGVLTRRALLEARPAAVGSSRGPGAPTAGRMKTPSASTVTPSASARWPTAKVLTPSTRSMCASARRSPSGVPRR